MKLVIQRVSQAKVEVDGSVVGKIGDGFLILAGVGHSDTEETVDKLARKTANLRIFADREGKTNLSLVDVGGEALVVSQFTLCADMRRGNRPSFGPAAQPDQAARLIDLFVDRLRQHGVSEVETGMFGAHMHVTSTNDGPFTILLEVP